MKRKKKSPPIGKVLSVTKKKDGVYATIELNDYGLFLIASGKIPIRNKNLCSVMVVKEKIT
jgi:hypothetical protein